MISNCRSETTSEEHTLEQTVYTIGHSTRSGDDFIRVLEHYAIEVLVDVRRLPGSRRLPQFDSATLSRSLEERGIDYCWIAQLGGRRRSGASSRNSGWRHPAFRAYADHLASDEFADGLFELLMIARGRRTAVMCAEILWWRCHRRLIADVLVVLGLTVVHIFDVEKHEPHRLTAPARLVGAKLSYEPESATA